ncbi:MAG: hypothetical protein PHO41_11635 [Eubacteriales bacterium]|nr:hypothetical protein [Eubacteriales bacterium]
MTPTTEWKMDRNFHAALANRRFLTRAVALLSLIAMLAVLFAMHSFFAEGIVSSHSVFPQADAALPLSAVQADAAELVMIDELTAEETYFGVGTLPAGVAPVLLLLCMLGIEPFIKQKMIGSSQ